MHISSSYAKILGETNFPPREFPRSGSKAKDGEKEREKVWTMVITMANYALLTPPRVAHAKPPGPKIVTILKSWWTGLDFTFSHDYSIFQWFGRDKSFESSRNFSISTTPPLTCFIITITTLARICLPHPSSSSHPPPEHVWSKKLCRAVPHPLPPQYVILYSVLAGVILFCFLQLVGAGRGWETLWPNALPMDLCLCFVQGPSLSILHAIRESDLEFF